MSAHVRTLACVATAGRLPTAGVDALAGCPDYRVRAVIAHRADLPDSTRAALLTDQAVAVTVRAVAALTDPDWVCELAHSRSPAVADGLARNANTPKPLLAQWARTPLRRGGTRTRSALANPATPTDAILTALDRVGVEAIAAETDRAKAAVVIARILTAHPYVAASWVTNPRREVAATIAAQPHLPEPVAVRLRAAAGAGMRELALNPYVPDHLAPGQHQSDRARVTAALAGDDPVTACADPTRHAELAAAGSTTLDLLIARAGAAHAALEVWSTARGPGPVASVLCQAVKARPDLAADVIHRFNPARLRPGGPDHPLLAGPRPNQAGHRGPRVPDVQRVADELGDNPDAWAVFIRTCQDGAPHLDVDELLTVTTAIVR